MRRHRAHVFDEPPHVGDAHTRALHRLKKTKTFQAMCDENYQRAQQRAGDRLTGMGY